MAQNAAAMGKDGSLRERFAATLARPFLGDELFDRVPDTVFFLKDREGYYVAVNDTLVERCGLKRKTDLLGRNPREVFPAPLGEAFARQDEAVLAGGSIHGQLELHLYPGGREGWGLTWKEPLPGGDGRVAGLAGITRDVPTAAGPGPQLDALSGTLDYVREHLDSPLRLPDLAARARLSVFQLDRRIRDLFGLSAGQYVTRARIEHACSRLRQGDLPISRIALECGYADQAAFTRQFRKSVGLTPKAYRDG
ncbi:MAG: helix-turn-helix domain-containing protein [Parvibaculaceae bacterium]